MGGEHFPRFLGGHGQVRGPQLVQVPGQPVAVQGQRRVTARGEHHVQARVPAAHERVQERGDLRIGEDMGVVDDEDERRLPARHVSEQRVDEIDWPALGRYQAGWLRVRWYPQRGGDQRAEASGLVIVWGGAHPGDAQPGVPGPFREQDRFTGARARGQEHERHVPGRAERREEAGTGHVPGRCGRNVQARVDEFVHHRQAPLPARSYRSA